jgi:hypothetical protein
MEDVMDIIQNRNLGENLQNLIQVSGPPNQHYRLNLISYNTLLSDWFKGVITYENYNIGITKIWDALFYFLQREPPAVIKKLGGILEVPDRDTKTSILYVASSPTGAIPLQVGFEFQKIRESIESGSNRESIELLLPLMAATLEGFMIEKNKSRPTIIHFSGHGTDKSLVFSTGANNYHVVSEPVLLEVFKGVNLYTKCIVLNACYAAEQAKTISEQGLFVIGMNAAISDPKAVSFSQKFYRGLGEGMSPDETFYQAKILIQSEFPNQPGILELWKDGQNMTLTATG